MMKSPKWTDVKYAIVIGSDLSERRPFTMNRSTLLVLKLKVCPQLFKVFLFFIFKGVSLPPKGVFFQGVS